MKSFKLLAAVVAVSVLPPAAALAAWEDPKRVDNGGDQRDTVDGDIATAANGLTSVFFWQNRTDEGAVKAFPFMNRRGALDLSWGTPASVGAQPGVTISSSATPPGSKLAAAPDGSAFAAFVDNSQAGTERMAFTDWPVAASAPSDRQRIAGSNDTLATLDIDTDGAGNAYAVFVSDNGGTKGIFMIRYAAGSGWDLDNTVTLHTSSSATDEVFDPHVDVNDDGDIALSYVKESPSTTNSSRTVIAMKRWLKGGSLSDERIVSQNDPPPGPNNQNPPGNTENDEVHEHDIAIDPAGDIIVVFAADPGRSRNTLADQGNVKFNRIYFQRWQNNLNSPTGADIAANNAISSKDPNAPTAFDPKIAVSPEGRFTAVWRQHTNPTQPEQSPGQSSNLLTSEYSGTWSQPPATVATGVRGDKGGTGPITEIDPGYDVVVDASGTATFAWIAASKVQAKQRPPAKDPEGEATVISQQGVIASSVDTEFAPRLSAGGTQVDAFWRQKLLTTDQNQGLAARFTPPAPPPPEPEPGPDQSDAVGCPAGNNFIQGTDGDDDLSGTAGDDTMVGLGGIDALLALAGNDCIKGGVGNDKDLSGGDGFDQIEGEGGDDTISGGAGNDAAAGGEGNDTIDGGTGIDQLLGVDGDDRLTGGAANDQLVGGIGNDRIAGGSGNDAVGGEDGNDEVEAGSGNDYVLAGSGDDQVNAGSGKNVVTGGDGNDRITARGGADQLFGEAGDDRVSGGGGNDRLDGGEGANRLDGQAGEDVLLGGTGIDILFGGSGRDTLTTGDGNDKANGGTGKDKIDTGAGNDSVNAVDGSRDRIVCGEGTDTAKVDRRDKVDITCEQVKIVKKKKKKKS